jgi:hypothetical protein
MKIWGRIHIDIETDKAVTRSQLDDLTKRINRALKEEIGDMILGAVDDCNISRVTCYPVSLGSLGFDPDQENNEQNSQN